MNNEKNMFEVATRERFRFPYRGMVSVEDLWDLSVVNLDSIFKTLNAELNQVKEESLLNTKVQKNTELETKIEIIKHIVTTKLAEDEQRRNAKDKTEKKQRILEIIASKQDEEMLSKSVEELTKMVEDL
jgi:hypothetical protein